MNQINPTMRHGLRIATNVYTKKINATQGAKMKQNGNDTKSATTNVSQSKNMSQLNLTTHFRTLFQVVVLAAVVSSCTKNRNAEQSENEAANTYAISMFTTDENSAFSASKEDASAASENDIKILDLNETSQLSADDVNVPSRIKFMFDNLPMTSQSIRQFKITFSVDRNNVTAYKIANSAGELNSLEKSLAVSAREVKLLAQLSGATNATLKLLSAEQKTAATEREQIKAGKATGALLVPMFKYEISGYGILQRTKNELKEETANLQLKSTDWSQASHLQFKTGIDSRKVIGMDASQAKAMNQLFKEEKIDKRLSTAGELATDLKIGLKFLDAKTPVLTRLSASSLLIYEVSDVSKLTTDQARIYKAGGSEGRIISCSDSEIKSILNPKNESCVIILVAETPVTYKKLELSLTDTSGTTSSNIQSVSVPKSQSVGLVEILENVASEQKEVTGLLDPDSSIKISDLQGEFMFRRTFEDAATSFLGRTGTSGDMVLVKFELENDRLVVRNQLSLLAYTGQGAKDREEIMSVPVKYYKMTKADANGSESILTKLTDTTKEKATHIKLDWLQNSIPDSSSPLAFFDAGRCFVATSSKKVTNTDMRLEKDGILNFSISSSHTVDPGCATFKNVNSAYWAGSMQLNFNVIERISFLKHTNKDKTDTQFSQNISYMAQEAFNFGVFTLADKNNENGTLNNRDGNEKYMPMIHDLRNGKKVKWHLGGINDTAVTTPERRQLLIEATQNVIKEWNQTFAISMKGTPLERSGDYIELVIEDIGKETGKLGDLNRNYIWLNEIPADNGLLGVAQPAANPRSGVIESSNVIVYTGNTFDQTQALLKITEISRKYEKEITALKIKAIAKASDTKETVSTKVEKEKSAQSGANKKTVQKISETINKNKLYLNSLIQYFELDKNEVKSALQGLSNGQNTQELKRVLNKDTFKNAHRNQKIQLPTNSMTLSKKMADLALDKKISTNDREFELKMNELFLAHGELTEDVKSILNKRQQMLALSVGFDKATIKRAGCFKYSRNDANDAALLLDADPKKNLMLNFKKSVMSTLSHELGHAFGLMHNFRASTDKANYEFKGETTGRNYSSIMDYISGIDENYAGPGPYDAHAIRAAYTGYVEMNEKYLSKPANLEKLKSLKIEIKNNSLVHIDDVLKIEDKKSYVHFTKSVLNEVDIIKHYEQCSDGDTLTSVLCARFDSGSSATEIVKNLISDYNRGYANRNYVYDKILFNWPQKIQVITRNIRIFSDIRSYLDETLLTIINGSGRSKEATQFIQQDLVSASMEGYKFFHELVRTPDTTSSFLKTDERLTAIPYKYEIFEKNEKGAYITKTKEDVKIIEARSSSDIYLSKDKMSTIGISYDKMFALSFLMQTTSNFTSDGEVQGFISYKDFEQFFLGVTDPKKSLTLNTVKDILVGDLKMGFFTPNGKFISENKSVDISSQLKGRAALAAVIGLNESKWKTYDTFAESFKVGRATVNNAPKDRLAVARAGQDKSKSDTTVYYAPQNAVISDVLIQKAALGDAFISNKIEIYKILSAITAADKLFMNKILDLKNEACAKNIASCDEVRKKSDDEYIKENPALLPAKQAADVIAKALVDKLQQLNIQGAIMPTTLDNADIKQNFTNQVHAARSLMSMNFYVIDKMKENLEAAPIEKLQETINSALATIEIIKPANDAVAVLPVMQFIMSYISDSLQNEEIKFVDGRIVPMTTVTKMMMDADGLQSSHDGSIDILEKLSQYSRFVDSDLLITK